MESVRRPGKTPVFTAIVLAAGSGSRMHMGTKKQFLELCGKPMVVYSLEAFEQNANISSIVLVVSKEDIDYALNLCMLYQIRKVKQIVEGGSVRFRSVYNGLKSLPEGTDYVLIHDGARPLLSQTLINQCCSTVVMSRACVAAVPVKDTIKVVDDNGFAVQTVDRAHLWGVQTPQAFSASMLIEAYEKLFETIAAYHSDESVITDDAVIVENMTDCRVRIVQGDYHNIKVTTPEDLIVAEAFLRESGSGAEEADR